MNPFVKARTPIMIALLTLAVTGCWDLTEPNQIAFVTASGWDAARDGGIEVSLQIPLAQERENQQAGGSVKKSFTVISASGTNIIDAVHRIQAHISRKLFPGHRLAVFIGEDIAKLGISQWMDEIVRNPDSNTRSYLFVVKGMKTKPFLEQSYPLERFTAVSATKTSSSIGIRDNMIYDYLREGSSPVRCIVLPVVEPLPKDPDNELKIHEIALFDRKHRLIGYLQDDEASLALWAAGKLTNVTFTYPITNVNGHISLRLNKLKRKLRISTAGERIKASVLLQGNGIVMENNTNLDLLNPSVKKSVALEMQKYVRRDFLNVINKVQKNYKADIFGFGNAIAWKNPSKWAQFEDRWESSFADMEIKVYVDLVIQGVGQVGSGPKILK